MSDILERCGLGIASARRVVGSQGPNDPAWEDSDPPSMAACLLLYVAEVERLTQRNHLETAVVAAALAVRQIERIPVSDDVSGLTCLEAFRACWEGLKQATDALLAFRDEEAGDE